MRRFQTPAFNSVPIPAYWIQEVFQWLTGRQIRILLFIAYKTIGWGKHRDRLALSQIEEGTGIDRANCSRAIHKLEEMGILKVVRQTGENGANTTSIISIIQDDMPDLKMDWGSWPKDDDDPPEGPDTPRYDPNTTPGEPSDDSEQPSRVLPKEQQVLPKKQQPCVAKRATTDHDDDQGSSLRSESLMKIETAYKKAFGKPSTPTRRSMDSLLRTFPPADIVAAIQAASKQQQKSGKTLSSPLAYVRSILEGIPSQKPHHAPAPPSPTDPTPSSLSERLRKLNSRVSNIPPQFKFPAIRRYEDRLREGGHSLAVDNEAAFSIYLEEVERAEAAFQASGKTVMELHYGECREAS